MQTISRPTTAILLAALLGSAPALADGGDVRRSDEPFAPLRDQGRHYLRMKLYQPALGALEKAARMRGADEDFRTQYYLAQVHEALLRPDLAFPIAERAATLATIERETVRVGRLLDRLERRFGAVLLDQAEQQQGEVRRGIIQRTGTRLRGTLEEVFGRTRARLMKTPVELPLTLYLPPGDYLANRSPFHIARGETVRAHAYLVPDDSGISGWWLVAGGSLVAAAAATTAAVLLLPASGPTTP